MFLGANTPEKVSLIKSLKKLKCTDKFTQMKLTLIKETSCHWKLFLFSGHWENNIFHRYIIYARESVTYRIFKKTQMHGINSHKWN